MEHPPAYEKKMDLVTMSTNLFHIRIRVFRFFQYPARPSDEYEYVHTGKTNWSAFDLHGLRP